MVLITLNYVLIFNDPPKWKETIYKEHTFKTGAKVATKFCSFEKFLQFLL